MNVIGIDIGTYSVKAVLLDPRRKYQVVGFYEERVPTPALPAPATPPPIPGEEGAEPTPAPEPPEPVVEQSASSLEPWQQALSKLMSRIEHDGDAAILSLPWEQAVTVNIPELPFDEHAKVAQILPGFLGDKIPMNLRSVVYDFQVISREGQNNALVGFAQKDDMSSFLEKLEEVHVNPALVGVPSLMLRYLAEAHIPEYESGTFAIIDMGHEATRVLVMQDGQTVLSRTLGFGGKDITESLMATFQASQEDAERLKHARGALLAPSQEQDPGLKAMSDAIRSTLGLAVRDLRRSFQSLYARDRVKLDKIYVCGGTSQIGGLIEHLSSEFGVPVGRLEVSANVDSAEMLPADSDATINLALSSALQQARDRAAQRVVNLRQDEFVYRGRSSYLRGALIRMGVAAAVLLVLLGIALFMQKRDLEAQRDAMRAAVAKQTEQIYGKSLYKASDIKKYTETEDTKEGGFVPKMSAYEVMYQITSKLRAETTITMGRLEVDAERNLIQIYGKTTTPQAVDDIVSDLEQLDCLKEIKKDKLQVKSEEEVNFELQISSGCS